jgi:AraC family transcriptional regulator, positive regulator of tynA and feaB
MFAGLPMDWSAKPSQLDGSFGSWADDLAAAFVRLEPRKITEHPFQGTIIRTEATPVRVCRVIATEHRILRLRSHIAQSEDDLCFINLQLEGVGRYTQRDHEQINGPADLAIVDTNDPDVWSGRARFRELVVSGLASMYSAFGWRRCCGPSWISARL